MSEVHHCAEGLRQACHDIRQPIAGVLALAGAALTEAGLPKNARTCLNQIVGLAEWQSDVIEHWLQAPEGGPADSPCTDVLRVVNEAIAAEQATWEGELTLVWPPEPVFVTLHSVTMRRMVANLLTNATRAAGPSGMVTVEISSQADRMMLAVEDNGPGFGRLPGSSGLGLSTVAREALRYHGRLACGRGALGGGRVNLWLPVITSRTGGHATSVCGLLKCSGTRRHSVFLDGTAAPVAGMVHGVPLRQLYPDQLGRGRLRPAPLHPE